MNFRIAPASGLVEVGDKSISIDLSAFPADITEVRWFGQAGLLTLAEGGDDDGPATTRFTDPAPYLGYVEAAQAAILERDTAKPQTLAEAQASAAAEIDALAGIARAQFISTGPGQEMTYLKKEQQALAMLAELDAAEAEERDPDLPDDEFFLIYGEVGITADDLRGVAVAVVDQATAWAPVAKVIETTRVGAKKQVREADSVEAVDAILVALMWPVAP